MSAQACECVEQRRSLSRGASGLTQDPAAGERPAPRRMDSDAGGVQPVGRDGSSATPHGAQ
jgi:hypothetical protein